MKLTDGARSIFYQRLTNILLSKFSESELKEMFFHLTIWNDSFRVIPYGLYEDESMVNYKDIMLTSEGEMFSYWLDFNTCNIEKPFNKSRKVTRLMKDLTERRLSLVKSKLNLSDTFHSLLASFFIDFEQSRVPINFTPHDPDRGNEVLKYLRMYLSFILYIEMLGNNSTDEVERILNLFVNAPDEYLYEDLSNELNVFLNEHKIN